MTILQSNLDILENVFSLLSVSDLLRLRTVSRSWNEIAQRYLKNWKRLYVSAQENKCYLRWGTALIKKDRKHDTLGGSKPIAKTFNDRSFFSARNP